jgi:AraC-like DNA-binding protein
MQRFYDRLIITRSTVEAAAVVESASAERLANAGTSAFSPLAVRATACLTSNSVSAVAAELGMSERQFRRVFREAVGMSPKAFAKLARFRRALTASQHDREASWASIAAGSGYYDQAHLIDEFRVIAGVTPRALLRELEYTSKLDAASASDSFSE